MMFGSVIATVFQSAFRSEIHQNNIFFIFLKIIFDISTSKRFKNLKKYNFKQKKSIFWQIRFQPRSQTHPKIQIMIIKYPAFDFKVANLQLSLT